MSHAANTQALTPLSACRHTHRRPLRPRQSGLDVYADLAWQQQILLCTPSSYCLCSARHGSLAHRSAAWRQIDCEHLDCPSWRGVWQSSDRHAELILQSRCLFSPASPSPLLGWVQSPCLHEFKVQPSNPPARLPLLKPPNLSLSPRRTADTDKITGARVSLLCFRKPFATWQWVMNGSSWERECSTNRGPSLKHTHIIQFSPMQAKHTHTHTHTHTYSYKNDAWGQTFFPL